MKVTLDISVTLPLVYTGATTTHPVGPLAIPKQIGYYWKSFKSCLALCDRPCKPWLLCRIRQLLPLIRYSRSFIEVKNRLNAVVHLRKKQ